jgi:hypothetical protein
MGPPVSYRKEIHDYIRCAEQVLFVLSSPYAQPLTDEERRLVEYYLGEFRKTLRSSSSSTTLSSVRDGSQNPPSPSSSSPAA